MTPTRQSDKLDLPIQVTKHAGGAMLLHHYWPAIIHRHLQQLLQQAEVMIPCQVPEYRQPLPVGIRLDAVLQCTTADLTMPLEVGCGNL